MRTALGELLEHTVRPDGIPNVRTLWDGKAHRIDESKYEDFWESYCQLAEYDEEIERNDDGEPLNMDLAEVPSKYIPIISVLTLRFPFIEDFDYSNVYTNRFIVCVIAAYQEAIKKHIQLRNDDEDIPSELICCVLEPTTGLDENDVFEIQFRIQFPFCCTTPSDQKRYIRPYVIKKLMMDNAFSTLKCTPINNWEQIIDPQMPEGPIPLYRSTTHPSSCKMMLVGIYPELTYDDIESGDVTSLELDDVFNPSKHSHVSQTLINPKIFDNHSIFYWLPLFLSLHYSTSVSMLKSQSIESNEDTMTSAMSFSGGMRRGAGIRVVKGADGKHTGHRHPYSRKKKKKGEFDELEEVNDPFPMAIDLLPLIRDNRWNEHTWLDLGKAIYTASNASGRLEEGFRTWFGYVSKHNPGLSRPKVHIQWKKFRRDNCYSVKTIGWYARLDNPVKYDAWHIEWCKPALVKASSRRTHLDVTIAFKRIFWLDFICASSDGNKMRMYMYDNHRWNLLDGANKLKICIQTTFRDYFEELHDILSRERRLESDEYRKKQMGDTLDALNRLISKDLTNNGFVNEIKKSCGTYFFDENFDKFKDTNPNLMGIENGVIETTNTDAVWRPGKPEDYITMCSQIYYEPDYTWDHPEVQEVMKWMKQCFPGNDVHDEYGNVARDEFGRKIRDYSLMNCSLKMFSSTLRSRNSDKIFPILTGIGDNSKSMLKKAMEAIFGPYCVNLPTSALTKGAGKSGNASPEFARIATAKQVWAQETDDGDTLRNGPIKLLTGGDTFFARALHDNGGDKQANFLLFLMCNKVPQIPSCDKAVKNRVRIFPFLGTWKKRHMCSADEEEQFDERVYPMDPFFEDRISDLAPAFLWVLVQYYAIYRSEGLAEPDAVKNATEKYWDNNDIYRLFTKECIQPVFKPGTQTPDNPEGESDENAMMSVAQVFDEFKTWYKEFFPGQKEIPTRDRVENQLCLRWGPRTVETGCWHGIQSAAQMMAVL